MHPSLGLVTIPSRLTKDIGKSGNEGKSSTHVRRIKETTNSRIELERVEPPRHGFDKT
jgi:hypothetical protein